MNNQFEFKSPSLRPSPKNAHMGRSPLIFLVDDDSTQTRHVCQALQDKGYRVKVFTELASFRADYLAADGERPAAVVIEMSFPEGDTAGIDIVVELGLSYADDFSVVITSVRDDLPGRLASFRAGISHYFTKPVNTEQLVDRLDILTGRHLPRPFRVLLVDDEQLLLEAYATILREAGMEVYELSQPLQFLDVLDEFAPDVVLLDMSMPEVSGPELAAVMRGRDASRHLPILFLSRESDMTLQLQALELGGDDFLVKPVQAEHLVAAVTARSQRSRQNSSIQRRLETTLYEREREHLALDQHAIVSISDRAGNITYVNERFCAVSGFSRDELLGQNHRIVKSDKHLPEFYEEMWNTIRRGDVWQGLLCNRRKDGSLYWVASSISPFMDDKGEPYQYVSIRTDITHLVAAETALRESEARLDFLLTSTPVTIYTCEAETPFGVNYISRNVKQLIGHEPEQFTDNSHFWLDNIHPDDRPQILAELPTLFENDVHQHEYRFRKADGSYCWLQDEMRLIRNEAGVAKEIVGYWADITARKHVEQELESSKERLRRGQVFANIGTWDWNIQSGELFWSERIAPLFGYEVGELETSYDNFLRAIHPDDRQMMADAVNACVEHDAPYDIEHRVVWPDGPIRWLHERGAVVRDAEGKPLHMLGVVQDITQRVEAETRQREIEERFSFAVEGAGDGVWDWDLLTNNMQFSHLYMKMLGYAENELPYHVDTWLNSVHPDDLARVQQNMQDYLEGRLPIYAAELRLQCKDGSYKWILCRGTVVGRDDEGKPVRMIGIHSDISDNKQAEQALIIARDEAERANLAKSDFLSSMSHELRTPMNAILGFGQLLEYDEKLSDENMDSVLEILKAGNHLLELINEILDLAKVESGHIALSLEPIELSLVVEECLRLVGTLANKRDIELSYAGFGKSCVRADRTRLKQVLLNLISNAIKYNIEGGSVKIDAKSEDTEWLRIQVTDTGPGIPVERLPELFQPFNRLDAENSEIEGSGIGLTITQRIIEIMGGKVGVESEVGVGSTFWIELPLESAAQLELDHEHQGATTDIATQAEASERVHTVLYIEDSPANLKLVAQIFAKRKHIHLLTAHTPELGIELALARRPELILMDINMPGMDGYQVLKVLKADVSLNSIPVVAISARAMPRDIVRGHAAGFNDYLTKPINIENFLKVIDRYLSDQTQEPA